MSQTLIEEQINSVIAEKNFYKNENLKYKNENALLQNRLLEVEEQLEWLKRQLFGQRSEKIIDQDEDQLEFDIGLEEPPKEEPKKKVSGYDRRVRRKGKDKLQYPSDLPIKTTIIEPPEDKKFCPKTLKPLVKIGDEVSHKLAQKPGSYFIKETIRPKYALPLGEGIIVAELPDSIIPGCCADESFLAEILTRKFADHLPLYRICESLMRDRIKISRKLLSSWVVRIGISLKPLYDEMLKKILASKNIFVDETPVKVQHPEKCKTAYMLAIVGGKERDPCYKIYAFKENHSHEKILEDIKNYRGIFHSDKYSGYETLAKDAIWCPCFVHIRRKFFDAQSGDPPFRKWVLRKIRYLFMFEKVAWARDEKERLRIRKEKEEPILDELIEKMKEKLADVNILPKSNLAKAIKYFCGLIPYLKNYTKHPWARLDNNVAERAIRPLVIGRKNWLFVGSEDAGVAAGVIFSLVQTCRALGVNPREYLEDILRRFMSHNSQKLYELLPDQWLKNRELSPP